MCTTLGSRCRYGALDHNYKWFSRTWKCYRIAGRCFSWKYPSNFILVTESYWLFCWSFISQFYCSNYGRAGQTRTQHHNLNDSRSNYYLTASQVLQSTWVPENRSCSSVPETPHSFRFCSLGFVAWALDLILRCVLTFFVCWGFSIAEIFLVASAVVTWPVHLPEFFSGI